MAFTPKQSVFQTVSRGALGSKRPPLVLVAAAVAVGLFAVLPLFYLTLRALGAGTEVFDLVFRGRVLDILMRTLLLVVTVTVATTLIAVPIAWVTLRTDVPFRQLLAVAAALPLVVPSYVAAYVAIATLGPRGMLQQLLEPLGVQRLPEIYGLPGTVLVLTFISYPYILLPVRAALMRIDPALEEVSQSLGYSSVKTFFRVTLPLLRPTMAAGGLLVALYMLSEFGAVSLMRYETFTWAIYLQYSLAFDLHAAAALSLLLTVIALSIVFLESRTRGRARYYQSSAGVARPAKLAPLGGWRWPVFGLVALPVIIGLVAPISVLVYWLFRGLAQGEALDSLWSAASNSVSVSFFTQIVAVATAAPVVALAVRFPSRLSATIEKATYVGFALPGIVVALSMIFVGINVLPAIYHTRAILIAAYLLLFLSVAVGTLRASLLQVNPHLEEVAQSLGVPYWKALLRVTVPLVFPGALAGGALVFLLTMKELPATLILGPAGFDTLATTVWSAVSEAFFARAAAPALLLILLAGPPTAYLVLRERWGRRA